MDYKKLLQDYDILLYGKLHDDNGVKNFITNLYDNLIISKKKTPTITSIQFPIYYLFDHKISEFGSSSEKLEILRNILEIDNDFSLHTHNLLNVGLSAHATVLYRFQKNGRMYIYYSNSGLGIKENQINNKNLTACKIFYIQDQYLYSSLPNIIYQIINAVKNVVADDAYILSGNKISKIEDIWLKLEQITNIFSKTFDKPEYDIIIDYILKNKEYKEQYLCYALLNYFCSKNKTSMEECTINHVLFGKDEKQYTDKIQELIIHDKLEKYIENTYNSYNTNIYNRIVQIPEKTQKNKLNNFINNINEELDNLKYDSITIKYKLENTFQLKYSNISGLYNNKQL
jgi:hypothetical protein